MDRLSSLDDVEALYAARGGFNYAEGVSQVEHALQCAVLAEADGAAPSLIVAALLHDIGHLFEDENLDVLASADGRHEVKGAQALKGLFGVSVRRPIALHVPAKRYLCCREPDYFETLSAASKMSLALQGGPFDAVQASAFERQPYWRDAVALRRYDDQGKRRKACGRSLADFTPLMRALAAV